MQNLIIPALAQPGFLCIQASVNLKSRSAFARAVVNSGCHVASMCSVSPGSGQVMVIVVAPSPVNMASFHMAWPAAFN
jgi:hypothetical protein